MLNQMKKKLEKISDLINVRNYINVQIENSKLDRSISHKYTKYVAILDKELAEYIIGYFEESNNENNKQ